MAAQLRSTDDTHVVHGRIAHLTDEDVGAVVAWVNASVDDPRSLMTLDNIVERLWAERERLVTKECLRKHLSDAALTKTVTAFPMEVERLRVTADAMAAYFDTAERIVCGIPAAFVFNVDESGVQEYADARGVDVVVPVSFEGMTAHYVTRRNAYRSTLVACISADGSALPPLVVMKAKTVPERIVLVGWTAERSALRRRRRALSHSGSSTTGSSLSSSRPSSGGVSCTAHRRRGRFFFWTGSPGTSRSASPSCAPPTASTPSTSRHTPLTFCSPSTIGFNFSFFDGF